MIHFEHVVKQYGKSNVRAVDDLNLHIDKGSTLAFIGPNGAGKTTTIRLLTGILQPTSGTVTIGTKVVVDAAGKIKTASTGTVIGVALESGVADELVEIAPMQPVVISAS